MDIQQPTKGHTMKPIQLTKNESLLLLACKGWDLTEFLTEPLDVSVLNDTDEPMYDPLKLLVFNYTQLTEYYTIVYEYDICADMYSAITGDLLELVTKLRPTYVNKCITDSVDIRKQNMFPEHNHLFQLLRNQISQLNTDRYTLCTEQLPTKFVDKYLKDLTIL